MQGDQGERSRQPARTDLPLLDALRILASFAVVRHHMRADYLFGVGFGLLLFLLMLFGLAASSTSSERLFAYARRRGSNLVVPWLRWSAIYVAVLALTDLAQGLDPRERLEPAMVFYGGHPSLWFLPFAAVAAIPLRAFRSVPRRLPPLPAALIASLAGVLAVDVSTRLLEQPMPDMPLRNWLRVMPTMLFGLALAQGLRVPHPVRRALLLALVVIVAVTSYRLSPLRDAPDDLPRRYAVAVSLAALGFGWRPAVPAWVRSLSTLTFGVYLVHPLVGKVLVRVFDVFAWPANVHAAVAWAGAAAVILALRRTPLHWYELLRPARRATGPSKARATATSS